MILLAQVRRQIASLPPPEPRITGLTADQLVREEKRRQLVKLLGEIERRKKAAKEDGSPNRWPQYQRTIAGYRPRPQVLRRRAHGKR